MLTGRDHPHTPRELHGPSADHQGAGGLLGRCPRRRGLRPPQRRAGPPAAGADPADRHHHRSAAAGDRVLRRGRRGRRPGGAAVAADHAVGRRSARRPCPATPWPSSSRPGRRWSRWATPTSPPTTCCSPWPAPPPSAWTPTRSPVRSPGCAAAPKVTTADPEGTYKALEKYGIDLTAARPRGQARPGHRPRRRDPAGRPGAVPAHQEQPGADRRARRRQDRRRRGPGPAHRRRRRPGVAARQAAGRARPRRDGRRREVPRRVRGAAQGRPGGDQGAPTARSSRSSTSCTPSSAPARRGEGAMDAGNMLKPMLARGELRHGRRDHARRVPRAHREGRRAGAPLPAGVRRRAAASRTPSRILRGLKERYEAHHKVAHRRLRAGRRRDAVRPLHHRRACCRTRRST